MSAPDGFKSFKVSRREGRQAYFVAQFLRSIRDLERAVSMPGATLPPAGRLIVKDALERVQSVSQQWEKEFCK